MKKKISEGMQILSFCISKSEAEQMKADAKVYGYSVSAFIRELWKDFKNNKEKK